MYGEVEGVRQEENDQCNRNVGLLRNWRDFSNPKGAFYFHQQLNRIVINNTELIIIGVAL